MELDERMRKNKMDVTWAVSRVHATIDLWADEVTQLIAERNAFKLIYQLSVHPVDVPHDELVKAHRIVKEFLKAEGN